MRQIAEKIGRLLLKKGLTLSIAESCTGGLLSSKITDIPGSSKYFKMSVIAYSNESKIKLLDVPAEIIKRFGIVSSQVATIMSKNVRRLAKTDFGIGVTGICGPSGGTPEKPVGLVYIAASSKDKRMCKEFRFSGDRKAIKLKASFAALDMLRKILET